MYFKAHMYEPIFGEIEDWLWSWNQKSNTEIEIDSGDVWTVWTITLLLTYFITKMKPCLQMVQHFGDTLALFLAES